MIIDSLRLRTLSDFDFESTIKLLNDNDSYYIAQNNRLYNVFDYISSRAKIHKLSKNTQYVEYIDDFLVSFFECRFMDFVDKNNHFKNIPFTDLESISLLPECVIRFIRNSLLAVNGVDLFGVKDSGGHCLLHCLIYQEISFANIDYGKFDYVAKNTDKMIRNNEGNLLLHYAAWYGCKNAIIRLLDLGFNPMATNAFNQKPIDIANEIVKKISFKSQSSRLNFLTIMDILTSQEEKIIINSTINKRV